MTKRVLFLLSVLLSLSFHFSLIGEAASCGYGRNEILTIDLAPKSLPRKWVGRFFPAERQTYTKEDLFLAVAECAGVETDSNLEKTQMKRIIRKFKKAFPHIDYLRIKATGVRSVFEAGASRSLAQLMKKQGITISIKTFIENANQNMWVGY